MGNMPLVSILIPVYNRESLVVSALKSALSQTYTRIEVVVGDNCSTDHSYEVIQKYAKRDSRILCFRNNENVGPVKNWIECLRRSSGEFIKILFSDDWLECDAVERYIRPFVERDDVGICFSDVDIHWEGRGTYRFAPGFLPGTVKSRQVLLTIASGRNMTLASPGAALVRRREVELAFNYAVEDRMRLGCTELGVGPDLLVTLFSCSRFPFVYYIPHVLAHYRGHRENLSIMAGKATPKCWLSTIADFVANEVSDEAFQKEINILILLSSIRLSGLLHTSRESYRNLFPDGYDPFRFSLFCPEIYWVLKKEVARYFKSAIPRCNRKLSR